MHSLKQQPELIAMQTIHLTNQPLSINSPAKKWLLLIMATGLLTLIMTAQGFKQALLLLALICSALGFGYFLILKGTVKYTLTPTHFQQHLFKGGWVLRWQDISQIGVCHYDQQGWQRPLPWVGFKLKRYSPYLDSICPRIATEILLEQRPLLYLGLRQTQQQTRFEEIVLDSNDYQAENGQIYHGLQAMLANRMRYQRENYDFDVFICASDLERPIEDFVGLARRYLAAAKPDDALPHQ